MGGLCRNSRKGCDSNRWLARHWSCDRHRTLCAGANVAFSFSKNKEMADELVAEVAAPAAAQWLPDGRHRCHGAEQMVRSVKSEFGSVDYLVNNAGITAIIII
jgi:NAD(P)-dependent dehydrogenase (short-subunit alcohol dehydrogenase family)